jgi:hypothetical protein
LVVQPQTVSWKNPIVRREVGSSGDGTGSRADSRHLTVRNEGRGYAQVTLLASVPWLELEPVQLGCLAGAEATVTVGLDLVALPLRRDQQAVISCTPARGARVSIPVVVELNLVREALLRFSDSLRPLLDVMWQGARQGFSLWGRTFRSLVLSRMGVGVLLAESVVLTAVMVVLWWALGERLAGPAEILWAFFRTLPLALVAVCLLPGLALVGGAAIWEAVRALLRR